MRDSQTEEDLRIRDFTTVHESTKVFRLEPTKKSHSMGETFCWSVVGQSEETRQTLRCCCQERTYIDANWNRQRWRTVGETNTGGEISWRDKIFDWRKRSQKTEPLEISYPIVDELGILRVGGRLDRAEQSYDAAHPMILPNKHHIKQ